MTAQAALTDWGQEAVDRDVLVIDTKTVALCIYDFDLRECKVCLKVGWYAKRRDWSTGPSTSRRTRNIFTLS